MNPGDVISGVSGILAGLWILLEWFAWRFRDWHPNPLAIFMVTAALLLAILRLV